jgi:hypothetical protein
MPAGPTIHRPSLLKITHPVSGAEPSERMSQLPNLASSCKKNCMKFGVSSEN